MKDALLELEKETELSNEGYLTLENGTVFTGKLLVAPQEQIFGEVVFTTGMTGYGESITDPSYSGQIIVFTYPLIGNYGVPPQEFWESNKIHLRGVVINETTDNWSHYQGIQSLKEWLEAQKIFLLTEVDTRALTKVLRTRGTMTGAIGKAPLEKSDFTPQDFFSFVSIKKPETYGSGKKRIILVDCGMKQNILRSLLSYGVEVTRVPHDFDYSEMDYDGVFLSNGPGDPVAYKATIEILKKAMKKKKPIYGICLGSQLMALASGAKTYRLPFGHRGHNQPCIHLETNKCYITSQNHGYAVDSDTLQKGWKVTFRNLNDNSVEGIAHEELPFAAVQFHPEACPGPTDTRWFFERFIACLS